ncbi:MBL fold metallo-hydrolase [Novipirellula artificiosorum]|uniref:Ribonuclease Z n=1 Tax=Novipirellula artificiosorum TaxID=2528016 RepID=A0A5C6DAK4_9BACT|nr:MBL fold metallo-hydrolase [Novipirellula artificiosorum]TWU32821.1 ribonuclease Z [Novipirellula artificiosorum]
MVENAPVLSHHHDGLTIEGYSRAAVQTCWRVNELKVLFDCGIQPWDFMGTSTLFISHTHLDHIAALPAYVSRRRMMKMDPPVIYLPDSAVDTAWDMLQMFRRLDRGAMPCELIGLLPGDETSISREYVVTALPTRHTIESLGFVVHQRRHKLKPEFVGLDGDKLRDLKLSGTEITQETRVPVFAYTGDTSPPGLDENPVFYEANVLVTEMTFVAPEHRKDKIHKHGHMHVDDYRKRADRFKNELIIAAHLSTRYNTNQVKRMVSKVLPDLMQGRMRLWL